MDSTYLPYGNAPNAYITPAGNSYTEASTSMSEGLQPPALPPRRPSSINNEQDQYKLPLNPTDQYGPPPTRRRSADGVDGIGQHYIRDPHKLIAYLVPLPKPNYHKGLLHATDGAEVPTRFLIYTPPPPPLSAPAEGEKEAKVHKLQRKWQEEVRSAKQSDAKVASWKGVKGRATKGIGKTALLCSSIYQKLVLTSGI